jgi:hypothetical protein
MHINEPVYSLHNICFVDIDPTSTDFISLQDTRKRASLKSMNYLFKLALFLDGQNTLSRHTTGVRYGSVFR